MCLFLTVDTITGGNRERDLKTGFTSPPKLTLKSLLSFILSPQWTFNYLFRKSFDLPFLSDFVKEGTDIKFLFQIILLICWIKTLIGRMQRI